MVGSTLSTAGTDTRKLADQLIASEPDRKVFYTEVATRDETENREHLWETMDKGHSEGYRNPLILGGGGDGTIHHLGKNMKHPDAPEHVAKALMSPLGLGELNDIFVSLHSKKLRGSLAMLRHKNGHEVTDYGLDITAFVDGEKVEDIALGYCTAGPSADSAAVFASESYRQFRERFPHWMHLCVDIVRGAPIVLSEPEFVYAMPTDGKPKRPITEVSFNNSERMGGLGNYARSTHLGDRAMHYAELRSNHPLAVAAYITRIALGLPPGKRVTEAVSLRFEDGGLHGQIEGEPIRGRSGAPGLITAITVKPGETPIRYYATRKR
jgi:hypothetical protein